MCIPAAHPKSKQVATVSHQKKHTGDAQAPPRLHMKPPKLVAFPKVKPSSQNITQHQMEGVANGKIHPSIKGLFKWGAIVFFWEFAVDGGVTKQQHHKQETGYFR